MKKLLILPLAFLAACSDTPTENKTDSPKVDSVAMMTDTTLPHPQSTVLDTIPSESKTGLVRQDSAARASAMMKNTPEGWEIMDTMTGDLNRDKYADMLIVLRRVNEWESDTDEVRPLLILTGNASGTLELAARNDNVVLCYHCGGVFGDPYDGLAIKNGYFSVEHYGGSSWRWTKIITFKYNEKEKTWLLHRDAGVSYSIWEEEQEPVETAERQEEYGKLKFVDYRYNQ